MADFDLDADRRDFSDLTRLFEDATLIASARQDVMNLDEGRRWFKFLSAGMHQIWKRLVILERRLR